MVVVRAGHNHISSFVSHWGVSPLPHLGSGGRVVAGIVVVSVAGEGDTVVVVLTVVVVPALVGTGVVVAVSWLQDTNKEVNIADVASAVMKAFFIVNLFIGEIK